MSKPQPEQARPLLAIKIRLAVPSDLNMVLKSWKKSLEDYSPEMRKGDYYSLMNALCDEILCGFPRIYIAACPEDENVILGWLCAEATPAGLVLWMGNTPKPYRRERVFARLVAHACSELDADSGPGTFFCPGSKDHPVRIEDYLRGELGAEHLSWAKALRLRERTGA